MNSIGLVALINCNFMRTISLFRSFLRCPFFYELNVILDHFVEAKTRNIKVHSHDIYHLINVKKL